MDSTNPFEESDYVQYDPATNPFVNDDNDTKKANAVGEPLYTNTANTSTSTSTSSTTTTTTSTISSSIHVNNLTNPANLLLPGETPPLIIPRYNNPFLDDVEAHGTYSVGASPVSSGRTSPISPRHSGSYDEPKYINGKRRNEYSDTIPFYVNRLVTQVPSAALDDDDYSDPFDITPQKKTEPETGDYEKPFAIFARENVAQDIPEPTAENTKQRFEEFLLSLRKSGGGGGGGDDDGNYIDSLRQPTAADSEFPDEGAYGTVEEIGGLPYQKIYPMSQLSALPIQANVDRASAESSLKNSPAGGFLVRKQAKSDTIVLSVIDGTKRFYHIKILMKVGVEGTKTYCIPPSEHISGTLEDLVLWYTNEQNNDALPCALTMHVNQERRTATTADGVCEKQTHDTALVDDMPEMYLERQSSLLVSTDYDSPRCLRCGQRLKGLLGKKRNLCQCCGVSVCNDCSSERLAQSPNIKVCTMCYEVNKDSKGLRTKLRPVPVLVGAGNLTKSDKKRSRWQERFFTLDSNGVFTYFKFRVKTKRRNTRPKGHTRRKSDSDIDLAALINTPLDTASEFTKLRSIDSGGCDSTSHEIGAAVGAINIREGCIAIEIDPHISNWPTDSEPLTRFGVETKQRTYYFVAKDKDKAQRWIGVLTLTAACCYGCGKKCFTEESKQCFAASDRGVLYHSECYRCCDCDEKTVDGNVDMVPLTPFNMVDGRLCCNDHTLARQRAAKSLGTPLATIENMKCKLLAADAIQAHIAESMQRYAQLALGATNITRTETASKTTPTISEEDNNLDLTIKLQNVSMSELASISDSTRLEIMKRVKNGELTTDDALKILLQQASTTSQREALETARTAAFGIHAMMAEVTNPSPLQEGDGWVTSPDAITAQLTLPSNVLRGGNLTKRESENFLSLEVVVHKPEAFRAIRKLSGIDDDVYRDSFDPKQLGVENLIGGGSSGCWVMRTHDENCIIKAVRGTEKDVLLSIIDKYTEYIEKSPNTLLTRILGIYDIRKPQSKQFTVLIMTNAMHNHFIETCPYLQLDEVYDLKGSTVGRRSIKVGMDTKENMVDSFSGTLKDLDLRRSFVLEPADCDMLVKQLEDDSEFLKSMGLMDYSLIVALHNCTHDEWNTHAVALSKGGNKDGVTGWSNRLYVGRGLTETTKTVYVFGIIDLLQRWGTSKVAENFAKSRILRQDKNGISAVNPEDYAARFTTLLGGRFEAQRER